MAGLGLSQDVLSEFIARTEGEDVGDFFAGDLAVVVLRDEQNSCLVEEIKGDAQSLLVETIGLLHVGDQEL